MRDYAKVSSAFWTGETSQILRCDPDAQRVAFYLITCPAGNMYGFYYLSLPTLCHEVGISEKGACKALNRLCEGGFCRWEAQKEWVFVIEMARYQIDDELDRNDNRVKGLNKFLKSNRKRPFAKDFWLRYKDVFHLEELDFDEAPCKPLLSQKQEQEQKEEQEQEQEQNISGGLEPGLPFAEILSAWNSAPGAITIRSLTEARTKSLKARLKEPSWDWRAALAKFPLKCFASQPDGWKPNFDWFLRPDTVTAILEGKYDWTKKENQNGKPTALAIGPGQRHDPSAELKWE